MIIAGRTASELWVNASESLLSSPDTMEVQSRNGPTHELLHVSLALDDPRQRWVANRHPPINLAFALAEVVWIIRGRNDSGFLNFYNSKLPNYAGTGSKYHGAYGYRLRKNLGFDQLQRAFTALSNNGDTRQIVLQIWDGKIDFPDSKGAPVNPDIPCNLISMLKVRNGKLHWCQIIRSNDLFLGLPYNLVQFTTLQEIIAGWLCLKLGPYHQLSDSLHAYSHDLETIRLTQHENTATNTDHLNIQKEESEHFFEVLESRIDLFRGKELTRAKHIHLSSIDGAPLAFQNMLTVLAAEAARRRKWKEESEEIMQHCSNPVFLQMWKRWTSWLATKRRNKTD